MQPENTSPEKSRPTSVLTVSEVANLLHVHTNTVRTWCRRGILTPYRLGKRRDRRFDPAEVMKLLEHAQTASDGGSRFSTGKIPESSFILHIGRAS